MEAPNAATVETKMEYEFEGGPLDGLIKLLDASSLAFRPRPGRIVVSWDEEWQSYVPRIGWLTDRPSGSVVTPLPTSGSPSASPTSSCPPSP